MRAALVELSPDGFEEVAVAGELEFAAYTDAAGEERLRRRFGSVGVAPVRVGWEDAWKRFHRPLRVGELWVGPPWECPDEGSIAVVIEPGRAFGTGAHPTTRLCLEFLLGLERGGLLDVGCGSGVLAVAGARLGYRPVLGLDVDQAAVECTRANAAANGVELDARLVEDAGGPLPDADVTVVNISLAAVEAVAERARSRTLVLSGYLESERPCARGWAQRERRTAGGWAADLYERP